MMVSLSWKITAGLYAKANYAFQSPITLHLTFDSLQPLLIQHLVCILPCVSQGSYV